MACPVCQRWHLPAEVHGWDTEAGLRLQERLARGRAALAGVAAPIGILAPVEAAPELSRPRPVKAAPAEVKGGRPKTQSLPWKERNRERLKAYKRAYMRAYMRRRRAKA
jgi:hypothetical protein